MHLGVNIARDALGIRLGLFHAASDKNLAFLSVRHRSDALAHAVFGDHLARERRGAAQIVGRAGGNIVQHDLLGDAPA